MKKPVLKLSIAILLMAAAATRASAEEVTLKALSFFPKPVNYAQSFAEFVDEVNDKGKGVVQINFLGGPEVTPGPQQIQALRNGIVDILYTPAGQTVNLVPEGYAFQGSTTTPDENRKSGAFEILDAAYQEKLSAKLLYHAAGTGKLYLFLTKRPKLADNGDLDLSDFRIRSAAPWVQFVESLGATNVVVPPGDVYAALERGVVDGNIWSIVGVRDFKWDRFQKYMVDPGFRRIDLLVLINRKRWEALSDKAKAVLTAAAKAHEKKSADWYSGLESKELDAMKTGGMEVVKLKGEARKRMLGKAVDGPWNSIKEAAPKTYEALREKMYKP